MKAARSLNVIPDRSRRAIAIVIADPHLVVAESPDAADPDAIGDALELLVKWAVRARRHCNLAPAEAAHRSQLGHSWPGELT